MEKQSRLKKKDWRKYSRDLGENPEILWKIFQRIWRNRDFGEKVYRDFGQKVCRFWRKKARDFGEKGHRFQKKARDIKCNQTSVRLKKNIYT